jgi:tetratricopeptide (TPR) repeat protein
MNQIIYITFFFFLFAFESKAESNMMFEKANQLYHNKMYDSASVLYSQLINDSYLSPNLFYNAGNSFYRTGKIGLAIWCYKKALQLEHNINIQDNLTLAQNKIKEPIYAHKDIFFIRWWKAVYNLFSVNVWALIGLFSFLIAMFILFLMKLKSEFAISKRVIVSLFSISFISLFFMLVKHINEAFHYRGIIIHQTNFIETHTNKNPVILSEGVEVEYNGIDKVGIQVILPNGQEGIIRSSDFKKL